MIHVQWDDPVDQSAIRYDFLDKWTWEEFTEAAVEARKMIDSVEHRVDAIANLCDTTHLAPNAIPQIQRAMRDPAPNFGVLVVAQSHPLIRRITEMTRMITPNLRIHIADTLDDARTLIQSLRECIPTS